MLRQSKGWGERFGIGRRRTAREDFSRGIVLTPADNPQAELLIFNGDGQRCILSEDDSQFVLALDAPSSPEERLSRAVLIGTSDDGSLSSLIRLRFPECNMTGRFQLQNMCESQIILGGIEYRWISCGWKTCTFIRIHPGADNEIIGKFRIRESGFCLKDVTVKLYKPVHKTVLYAMLFGVGLQIRDARYAWWLGSHNTPLDNAQAW